MQLEGEENSHADRLTLKISLARCNQASCFIVFGEGAAVAGRGGRGGGGAAVLANPEIQLGMTNFRKFPAAAVL